MFPSLLGRAVGCALLLSTAFAPAYATFEGPEDKAAAASAAEAAMADMLATFDRADLKTGEYLWKRGSDSDQVTRVIVSLSDQLAFAYHDDELVGVSTISSGNEDKPTPTGIFPILDKQRLHRSIKYDNAPMPFMQRLDDYGIALHGGHLPGYPASHGCVRLPTKFAAKLFGATKVGTVVMIGSPDGQPSFGAETSRIARAKREADLASN